MDIKKKDDAGTGGNTYQKVTINHVENYFHGGTTVINNHYGEGKKAQRKGEQELSETDRHLREDEIMRYVGHVKQYVVKEWKNRYEATWRSILEIPEVSAVIYEPGKQKDTTFNRNLVANILYIMCNQGIITETTATELSLALEGNTDHSVRAQLHIEPNNREIIRKVERLLNDYDRSNRTL